MGKAVYQTDASDGIGIADIQCKQILGGQYHQLARAFSSGVSIPRDEIKRITDLITVASNVRISQPADWFRGNWI